MFSFTPLKTIAFAAAAGTVMLTLASDANGQSSEFERRAEAMRRARSRQADVAVVEGWANEPVKRSPADASPARSQRTAAVQATGRVSQPASRGRTRSTGPTYRVAQASAQAPVARNARSRRPATPRVAQNLAPGVIYDGVVDGGVIDGTVIHSGGVSDPIIHQGYADSGYIDGGYAEAGCDSCGTEGSFFEGGSCGSSCDTGSCCGRGGCAPGDCWLAGLGGILRNGDYFFGATGFQEPLYRSPNGSNQLIQDSNFGFYGGFNVGVPLCRLTCGVLSGQVGVRSVQSNLNGNQHIDNTRNQLFVTAGLYRRVDYGLQFGVVGDFLQDEFYGDASLSQIRSDLGWVFSGGSTFGFRYTAAQQSDVYSGTFGFGNTAFANESASVHDQYRFYLQTSGFNGGYGELFAGWTENNQTILGMEFDVPLNERVALESSFTYFLNDDEVLPLDRAGFAGSNANEAWNLSVGIVFRPQGRAHYKNYDRPLFDVADNGTMLIRRGN